MHYFIIILYLIASIFFILGLRGLSSPNSARKGNIFSIIAMIIVIVTTLFLPQIKHYMYIILSLFAGGIIGSLIAYKTHMKQLPQLIAFFHSLVGLSASLVAISVFYAPESFNVGYYGNINFVSLIELSLGLFIGIVTFAGSLIAFFKLQGIMSGKPIIFPKHNFINLLLFTIICLFIFLLCINNGTIFLWGICILSLVFGIFLIIPIGGADMPVVVSMLNSYSGWATAGIGFTLQNPVLITVGAIVGASGAILSYIMCKGMNRSIWNVIFSSAVSNSSITSQDTSINKSYRSGSAEDAAFLMKNSNNVIIVPGYGMAVASAQHVLKEMTNKLRESGVNVKFAIHPVAGRMPGHMNVLLAEAGIPYEDVYEMETINSEFPNTDVAYVIGANDVTNPAAKHDPSSPIYGMPVLDVIKAKTIFFVKRSMGTGYSGIDNELFYDEKTIMLLGDAKTVTESVVIALEHI